MADAPGRGAARGRAARSCAGPRQPSGWGAMVPRAAMTSNNRVERLRSHRPPGVGRKPVTKDAMARPISAGESSWMK